MKLVRMLLVAGVVLGLASLSLAQKTSTTHKAKKSSAQKTEMAESAQVFKTHCAMCHGPHGEGNTPMGKRLKIVDLHSPEVQKKTDAELTSIIDDGKGKMPAFKSKLKPEQVHDLVTYIHDLAKEPAGAKK